MQDTTYTEQLADWLDRAFVKGGRQILERDEAAEIRDALNSAVARIQDLDPEPPIVVHPGARAKSM